MAAQSPKGADNVPLPDPDLLQRSLSAAMDRVRARRGIYILLGVLLVATVLAVLVIANIPSDTGSTYFNELWVHCMAARQRLERDLSATDQLADLERYLETVRGTEGEGMALWFLALYNYRQAWLPSNPDFEAQRPFLEKAAGYLRELEGERFDELLLAKREWFTADRTVPVDVLRRQVESDLAWARDHAASEPKPDTTTIAVLRTELGDIYLHLYREHAPEHVKAFLTNAQQGTYNDTAFHFVRHTDGQPVSVMGGDPFTFFYPDPLKRAHILRWGKGGLGFDLPPEESRFKVAHRRGIVTSQRVERADWDNGSQFQIMLAPDRTLDRVHTPFAKVAEGMDVVEKIAARKRASTHDTYRDDPSFRSIDTRDLLVEPVRVHKVIVYENRQALEHAFPLADGERSLDTLTSTPAEALPPESIACGRTLRATDAVGEVRPGLDVPFPEDVDIQKADPAGERG